jgi:hypothetical protein
MEDPHGKEWCHGFPLDEAAEPAPLSRPGKGE